MATVKLDGPCPLLRCTECGPHEHPVCDVCGAVAYGNAFCRECRDHWTIEEQ